VFGIICGKNDKQKKIFILRRLNLLRGLR
jgi:hypothetical protein